MNTRGFWGESSGMTHLQFQNGYHQYKIFEYLRVRSPNMSQAIGSVTGLADKEDHFAPYPGGGGCYDYDAVHILTGGSDSVEAGVHDVLRRTFASLLAEHNADGGFAESLRIRPRSFANLAQAARHILGASGPARWERLRYCATLLRPKHDLIQTHWSSVGRGWGQSNLWDSWFRMLTLARIEVFFNPAARAAGDSSTTLASAITRVATGPRISEKALTGRGVYYFSPSVLPSRTANSIHVVRMCEAFASLGCEVTLFCQRSVARIEQLNHALADDYGARLEGVRVESCYRAGPRGANLAIVRHARSYLRANPLAEPAMLVSRNLYASAWLALSGRGPLVFETHQVENGWRFWIQRYLLRKSSVRKVVVSRALRDSLERRIGRGIDQCLVLHDAAPAGLPPKSRETTGLARSRLADRVAWQRYRSWAGYVGHLYPGRGIEIIEQLARRHPETGFLIVGGNPEDVAACKTECTAANMHFVGHEPPAAALHSMHAVDVLLMPYQQRVSIGPAHSDTARWMSPMKMFEYMASGVPVIASKLPVLMEVLRHGGNALLAEPERVQEWSACLSRLLGDAAKAERLASQARAEYEGEHTWRHRAEKILNFSRA